MAALFYGAEQPGRRAAARALVFGVVVPASSIAAAVSFNLLTRWEHAIAIAGAAAAVLFAVTCVIQARRWRVALAKLLHWKLDRPGPQASDETALHRCCTARGGRNRPGRDRLRRCDLPRPCPAATREHARLPKSCSLRSFRAAGPTGSAPGCGRLGKTAEPRLWCAATCGGEKARDTLGSPMVAADSQASGWGQKAGLLPPSRPGVRGRYRRRRRVDVHAANHQRLFDPAVCCSESSIYEAKSWLSWTCPSFLECRLHFSPRTAAS